MLSIVPLVEGGGLYETGQAVQPQNMSSSWLKKTTLRWDSLGEMLALAVSLEDLGIKENNPRIKLLAKT